MTPLVNVCYFCLCIEALERSHAVVNRCSPYSAKSYYAKNNLSCVCITICTLPARWTKFNLFLVLFTAIIPRSFATKYSMEENPSWFDYQSQLKHTQPAQLILKRMAGDTVIGAWTVTERAHETLAAVAHHGVIAWGTNMKTQQTMHDQSSASRGCSDHFAKLWLPYFLIISVISEVTFNGVIQLENVLCKGTCLWQRVFLRADKQYFFPIRLLKKQFLDWLQRVTPCEMRSESLQRLCRCATRIRGRSSLISW